MLKKSSERALSIWEAQQQLASRLQHLRYNVERSNNLRNTQVLKHVINRNHVKEFVVLWKVFAEFDLPKAKGK